MLPSHVDLVSVDINCTSMYVGGFLVYNRKQHNNVYIYIYMITTACIFIEAHTVHVRCMIWYDIDYIMCGVIAIRGFPRFRTWQCFTWDEGMPMSAFSVPIFSAHDAFPYLRVTLEEISCRTKQKKSDCWKVDDPTAFCFDGDCEQTAYLRCFPGCPGSFFGRIFVVSPPGAPAEQQAGASEKSLAIHSCKALDVPTGSGCNWRCGIPSSR